MKKFFSTIWTWLVVSSANPKNTSLTVKAVLSAVVVYATMLAGLGHIPLPTDQITNVVDLIVQFVQSVLIIVSLGIATFGAVRKVYLTLMGQNIAMNQIK